jgi:hypothetical protein
MGRKNRILEWKYTNAPMNARDLSRDDDLIRYGMLIGTRFSTPLNILLFCSHMLVESLGTVEPLTVHKMDPSRVLPEFDPDVILNLIQKVLDRVEYPRSARLSGLTLWFTACPLPCSECVCPET